MPMDWAGKQHPLETLVEWCAPAFFAGAVGWSTSLGGIALPVSIAAAGVAFAVGIMMMRLAESSRGSFPAFEPVSLEIDGTHLDECSSITPWKWMRSNRVSCCSTIR